MTFPDNRAAGCLRRALRVPLVLTALIVSVAGAAPAGAHAEEAIPLDLAAMVLTPADLAGAGQVGLGLSYGTTLAPASLADRATWPAGPGAAFDRVEQAITDAGFAQAYEVWYTSIRDVEHPAPPRDINVEVVAYDNAEGAAEAFGLVPDAYETGEIAAVSGTTRIGDESRLTLVHARDPGAGTPHEELVLGFRTGRFTARILIRDSSDRAPQVPEVETLASTLLARIGRVASNGAPDLSLHALRPSPRDEMTPSTDAYLRLNGEDTRSAFETPDDLAHRTARYGDAISVFAAATELRADDSSYVLGYATVLYEFATAEQADAWFESAPGAWESAEADTAFAPVQVPPLGDRSFGAESMHLVDDGIGSVETSIVVLVRAGAFVAEVRLSRLNDSPAVEVAVNLAAMQVECLAGLDCVSTQPFAVTASGSPAPPALT